MDSMIKNRINHPDVRYNDYLKINNIINNPDKIILDDKQHIKMFKQIDNKIYETIVFRTLLKLVFEMFNRCVWLYV